MRLILNSIKSNYSSQPPCTPLDLKLPDIPHHSRLIFGRLPAARAPVSGRKIHFRQENSFSLPPWPLCRARPAWPTAPQPSSRTSGWRDAAASEPLSVCLSCPSVCPSVRPFPGSHPASPTGVPPGCLRRPSEGLGARPAGIPPPPPGTARTGGGDPLYPRLSREGSPTLGAPPGTGPRDGGSAGTGDPRGLRAAPAAEPAESLPHPARRFPVPPPLPYLPRAASPLPVPGVPGVPVVPVPLGRRESSARCALPAPLPVAAVASPPLYSRAGSAGIYSGGESRADVMLLIASPREMGGRRGGAAGAALMQGFPGTASRVGRGARPRRPGRDPRQPHSRGDPAGTPEGPQNDPRGSPREPPKDLGETPATPLGDPRRPPREQPPSPAPSALPSSLLFSS